MFYSLYTVVYGSHFHNDHYGHMILFHFTEIEKHSAVCGESFVAAQSQPYSLAGDSGISIANTQTSFPTGTPVRIDIFKKLYK